MWLKDTCLWAMLCVKEKFFNEANRQRLSVFVDRFGVRRLGLQLISIAEQFGVRWGEWDIGYHV